MKTADLQYDPPLVFFRSSEISLMAKSAWKGAICSLRMRRCLMRKSWPSIGLCEGRRVTESQRNSFQTMLGNGVLVHRCLTVSLPQHILFSVFPLSSSSPPTPGTPQQAPSKTPGIIGITRNQSVWPLGDHRNYRAARTLVT